LENEQLQKEGIAITSKIDFEKIVKAAPLFYGFLIFCGALYLYIYFSPFHIDIFKYLELSELLVSFIHVIFSILFLFVVFVIEIIAFSNIIKHKELTSYKNGRIGWLIGTAFLTAVYITFASSNSVEEGIKYNSLILVPALVAYAIVIWHEFKSTTEESISYLAVYLMLALIVGTVYEAISDSKSRVEAARNEIVTITTKDSTITTNANYFYVGRTNSYIFLYNLSGKRRDIIPANEIKQITFKLKD